MSTKTPLAYRLLLRLLPPRFRRDFGADLEAVLVERLRDAPGAAARVWVWLIAVVDILTSAPAEWAHALRHQRNAPGSNGMDHLKLDLRFALRSLARRPGFAAIAVITLALGIGANTAIFSVVNGVLLTPLPYPQAERLVTPWAADEYERDEKGFMSKPDIDDLAATNAFESLVGYGAGEVALTGMGEAELVHGARVTGGLLEVFGLRPHLGRDVRGEEAVTGAAVVVVSHALWTQSLGADPGAVGRSLELDDQTHEIVGVAPAGFDYPEGAELWRPSDVNWENSCDRGCRILQAIGRLAPGATLAAAKAEADALAAGLEQAYPASNDNKVFNLVSLEEQVVGDVRMGLWVLLAAVAIVLLIACANVANLLLVRAQSRSAEVAVRAALGASGWRLAGQVILESIVLALAGGATGVGLAVYAVEGLRAIAPADLPRLEHVTVDGTVLLFALGLVVAVTVLFGMAPALRLARSSTAEQLSAPARRSADRREMRSRNLLLAGEVALSVTLLVGAGLLLKSFSRMVSVEPGYETRQIVRFTLSLPDSRYGTLDEIAAFVNALEQQVRAVPGVEAVGSVFGAPMGRGSRVATVRVEGRPDPEPANETYAAIRTVTHGYLETMKIPVLRGRDLERSDDRNATPVALVNERFVRENFPGQEVIGARVRSTANLGSGSPYFTIVGVLPDILSSTITGQRQAEIYVPLAQMGPGFFTVNVRGARSVRSLLPVVREQVRALDGDLPLRDVETMEQVVQRELASGRFYLMLVGLFAGLAVVLAAVGLYGVVAYFVSRRTSEIGLRMAIGAGRGTIAKLVLGQGLRPAAWGLVVGLLAAYVGSRVLESLLFQVEPTDPLVFAGVTVLLSVIVTMAMLLPVRRATRVDAVEALRAE